MKSDGARSRIPKCPRPRRHSRDQFAATSQIRRKRCEYTKLQGVVTCTSLHAYINVLAVCRIEDTGVDTIAMKNASVSVRVGRAQFKDLSGFTLNRFGDLTWVSYPRASGLFSLLKIVRRLLNCREFISALYTISLCHLKTILFNRHK